MLQEINELLLARHHKEKGYNPEKLIDLLLEEIDDLHDTTKPEEEYEELKSLLDDSLDQVKEVKELVANFADNYFNMFRAINQDDVILDIKEIARELDCIG